MFKNYLVVAWRNLLKSKVYSFINISGLSIGLACSLAIMLFVVDEYSHDRFHENADNIYRVVQRQTQAGDVYQVASSPALLGEALKSDFPEVVSTCHLGYKRSTELRFENTTIEAPATITANPGFLDVFDFELIRGDRKKLFSDPKQIVLSDKVVATLFGSDWGSRDDLLGSTIVVNKGEPMVLAGILRAAPRNSHIAYDAILAFDPAGDGNDNWFSNNYLTYIELADGADPGAMDEHLHNYITRYADSKAAAFNSPVFYLQPLTDIYLYSQFDFHTDWTKTSSILYVRIFVAVGIVVLLIALFNFINLSTARAMRRAKEVGIRKTIGAHKSQLMLQFLSESMLMTSLSVLVALALTDLALPFLNAISSKELAFRLTNPIFLGGLIVFTTLVSMIAGTYPALYLSSFRPARVLKNALGGGGGQKLRQALVVMQFSLTITLVGATIVIHQQLKFIQSKDLGFEQEELIYLQAKALDRTLLINLRDDLRGLSSVRSASLTSNSLIDVVHSTSAFDWEGKRAEDKLLITRAYVDADYLATTGMRLIAGRNFSGGPSDSSAYIINRTAATQMGWSVDEALGKEFALWHSPGQIIGIIEDFHFRPMTAAIEPLVLSGRADRWYEGIMIKAAQLQTVVADIEAVYKKYEPETPAHFSFVDQQLAQQYRLQDTTGKLVLFFSSLAIFVACLGLYGLAAFTAERRTKEIGIRRVLGASVRSVSMLLSRNFISLVLMSILIAFPLSWWLSGRWLEDFAYRIDLEWTLFALAGMLALVIAAVTVLSQAFSAANANPVDSLRSE
jgi:putative ABC transport system permease protein